MKKPKLRKPIKKYDNANLDLGTTIDFITASVEIEDMKEQGATQNELKELTKIKQKIERKMPKQHISNIQKVINEISEVYNQNKETYRSRRHVFIEASNFFSETEG